MKNTRKKMLLSSVAMLLVALVALGAATYAWYSEVTTVTAEKTQFNASTSTGIVIRHENDTYTGTDKATQTAWTTALNSENHNALKTASSLPPRAITTGLGGTKVAYTAVKGASAKATDRTSYAAKSHTLIDNVPNDNGYLVDHMFVAGEGGEETVTMTLKSGLAAQDGRYLNLAVYVGGNLEAVFTDSNDGTTKDLTVSGSTASEGAPITPTKFTGSSQTVKASFKVGSKASGGTEIQIIGYVDGFNTNCKSDSVNVSNLTVDYKFDKA